MATSGTDGSVRQETIDRMTLLRSFIRERGRWDADYPTVLNPQAVVDGVTRFMSLVGGSGRMPEVLWLTIVDRKNHVDERQAKYRIKVQEEEHASDGTPMAWSIWLYYIPRRSVESLSTVETDKVTWSADNMRNSTDRAVTAMYMGFCYKICDEWSDGYDREVAVEENTLTYESLVELGIDGDIPAEMVSGIQEMGQIEQAEEDAGTEALPWSAEEATAEVPEEDDTDIADFSRVVEDSQGVEDEEEEYDLQISYEDSFDDE